MPAPKHRPSTLSARPRARRSSGIVTLGPHAPFPFSFSHGLQPPFTRALYVHVPFCGALFVALVAFSGCGAASARVAARADELRTVAPARALELIREVVAEVGLPIQERWPVDVGHDQVTVDARLGQTDFGVEWATAQDRIDHPDAWPAPDGDGQLQLVQGAGESSSAQVLILDDRSYQYDPDLERVQGGSVGVREAEGRLRRDLGDYIEYVRGQGGL